MRYGTCLDWLNRTAEATWYYDHACEMDPYNPVLLTWHGWHYVHLHNYACARECFQKSLDMQDSPEAQGYLQMVNNRIAHPDPLDLK